MWRSILGLTLLISTACDGTPPEDAELQELKLTHAFELCNPSTLLPTEVGKVKGLTELDWVNQRGDALRFQFTPEGTTQYERIDSDGADLKGTWTHSERTLNTLSRYKYENEADVYAVERDISYFATSEAALYHASCGAVVFYRAFGDSDAEDDPLGLNGIWAAEAQSESYDLDSDGAKNIQASRHTMILAIQEGTVQSSSTSCSARTTSSGNDEVDKGETQTAGHVVGSTTSFELNLVPEEDEVGFSQEYLGKMLGDNTLVLYPTDEDSQAANRSDCTRLDE